MLPQLSHLQSQYWLSCIQSKPEHSDKLMLVQKCLQRLAGVVSGNFTSFSKRELPRNHLLYALLSKKCLNDEHINACRFYLVEKLGPDSPIRIVNLFFLGKLAQIRQDNLALSPGPRQLNSDIQSHHAHTLLIPVHLPGHWTLLVVDITERTYSYSDTLDLSMHEAPVEMVDNIEWWLCGLLGSVCVLKASNRRFETGRQTDSVSCGITVMTTMSQIALTTPGWAQAQATALHMEWFLKFTKPSKECKIGDTAETTKGAEDNSPEISTIGSHPINTEPKSNAQVQSFQCLSSVESPLKPPTSLKQATLNFPKVGQKERQELDRQRALKRKAEDEALGELEERLNEEKFLKNCQKARDKKRHQRENKKARLAKVVSQKNINNAPSCTPLTTPVTSNKVDSVTPGPLLICGLAELSRPHRQSKHILSGHDKEEAIVAAKHVNWMNPILFHLVDAAANEVGFPWRPADISKRLKLQYPHLFEKLWPQRISDWKDGEVKDRLKWKDSVLKAIESGNHPGGVSTRQPILVKYPEMVSILKERLIGLRVTGTPLDTATIRGFMIATISERAPELFECKVSKDKQFRCSSEFIRSFLHNELDWSLRRPTQAAQKVPANVNEVLMKAFLRMACAVRDENIPSHCIVNSDQTQVVYSTGTQYTWHKQGDKQVPVLGKDEKRAFTLLVGVSNDGKLLPLQAIYQGMSNASLPHRNASGYAEAIANHVFFVASMTATYWSTLQTMKDYVNLILVPYFQCVISIHGLPSNQRCIWQIDVWSVHRSEKFRDWLATTYLWIILQYKIAKAAIRQRSLADIINETTMALRNGADPTTLVNDKSIGTLRNRSVSWINEAIRAINNSKLIQKAFALCTVPGTQFNLSYESLTSHEARQAIRELKTSNPEFHTKITAGRPVVPSSEQEVEPEDDDSTTDELSTANHIRIVMGSTTAMEATAQQDAANQDSDDESTYEPPALIPAGASNGSGSMPARREIPKRAAKKNTSYTLQEWWNRIDIDN